MLDRRQILQSAALLSGGTVLADTVLADTPCRQNDKPTHRKTATDYFDLALRQSR